MSEIKVGDRVRCVDSGIAAWGEGEEVGSHFDSPHTAEVAREALRRIGAKPWNWKKERKHGLLCFCNKCMPSKLPGAKEVAG